MDSNETHTHPINLAGSAALQCGAKEAQPNQSPSKLVGSGSSGSGSGRELLISGQTARIIIKNAHALLRYKCRKSPLWSMVSSITGHGSGYSWEICVSANLDPGQDCGVAHLKDYSPNIQTQTGGATPPPKGTQ